MPVHLFIEAQLLEYIHPSLPFQRDVKASVGYDLVLPSHENVINFSSIRERRKVCTFILQSINGYHQWLPLLFIHSSGTSGLRITLTATPPGWRRNRAENSAPPHRRTTAGAYETQGPIPGRSQIKSCRLWGCHWDQLHIKQVGLQLVSPLRVRVRSGKRSQAEKQSWPSHKEAGFQDKNCRVPSTHSSSCFSPSPEFSPLCSFLAVRMQVFLTPTFVFCSSPCKLPRSGRHSWKRGWRKENCRGIGVRVTWRQERRNTLCHIAR